MLTWVHHSDERYVDKSRYLTDITPDGKFFVMMYREEASSRCMHVVDVNEMTELAPITFDVKQCEPKQVHWHTCGGHVSG